MRVKSYGDLLEDLAKLKAGASQWMNSAQQAAATIQDPKSGIEWIRIQTAYGPDILIEEPLVPGASTGNSTTSWLKPKVSMKLRPLATPLVLAPEGDPGETKWPLVSMLGVLGVGLAGVFILRGILR